jgi:hypothetical protein
MSPTEVEEMLAERPFKPLRLTLASGDYITIEYVGQASVSGLTLVLKPSLSAGFGSAGRSRLVSIPNICLVERVYDARRSVGRKRQ